MNMNRVLLIIGLVLVTFIGYRYISYSHRTNTKISQFENTFIKNFGDGAVYMGWIGLFIGFIIILESSFEHICPFELFPNP